MTDKPAPYATTSCLLGQRFEDAVIFATRLHATQLRKGTAIPYVAHLLAVASLVLEDGGDEDQTIAALLHDAVEDQGGPATFEAIGTRFGERVAGIVQGCTDADTTPKPPWQERKGGILSICATRPARFSECPPPTSSTTLARF